MARRLRSAIEIVSDIGALGFDLQHHTEEQIAEAVKVLRTVNPEMFDWLVKSLQPPTEPVRDPEVWPCSFGYHKHATRDEAVECARSRIDGVRCKRGHTHGSIVAALSCDAG